MQSSEYQWVQPSGAGRRRQRGYWRRLARTVSDPTQSQALQRLRMSLASSALHQATGTTHLADGRSIPNNAVLVAPLLRGSPNIVPAVQQPIPTPITRERRLQTCTYPPL